MIGLAIGAAVSGLVGSPHCAGMCGPFAAACGGSVEEFGAWHAGRLTTYGLLGAAAGTFGTLLPGPPWVGAAVSVVLLLAFSLVLAGLVPEPKLGGSRVGAWAMRSLQSKARGSRFAFGLANGLLPCGLVYAALGLAVAAGSALGGGIVMVAFGAGTTPMLSAVSVGVRKGVGRSLRARRALALLVFVTGLVSVWMRTGSALSL